MTPKTNGTRSTLKQVAEAAGVSVAAASKVLNGRGSNVRISEERACSIRAAAEKLRYRPNALASSLRMSRTNTIGLIWERMSIMADGPLYYVYLLDGVSRVLFQHHYRLTILPEIPEVNPVGNVSDGRLDGVIWCKLPADRALIDDITHSGFKVVALNSSPSPDGEYISVTCDNFGGAELVVDHLVSLGHKKILIAMDHGWVTSPDASARLEGFKSGLAKNGLEFQPDDLVMWDTYRPQMAEWWATNPPHTAVFAWHDGIAGGIIDVAPSVGINIPADLSLVGFDSTKYCENLTPRLTSVHQPVIEMSECAAHLLIDLIEGREVTEVNHLFPCTLDIRDTTTRPAPRSVPKLIEEAYRK